MEYCLEPRYDSRKSFYGKAIVKENGNVKDLISYSTKVASIIYEENRTIYRNFGYYSMTTSRHQAEFFKQEGLSDKEIKELKKRDELIFEIN